MTEKFVSPSKPPEGLERELLTILGEECNEIAVRASKALRFGTNEIQPGQPLDNIERLSLEIGDLMEVVFRLEELGLVNPTKVEEGQKNKRKQLAKFLQNEER